MGKGKMHTGTMRRRLKALAGASAVALVAMAPLFAVEAAPAAPQATPVAPSAPAQTPPTVNPQGATSTGGSFFAPPTPAKNRQRQVATGNALAAAEVPEPAMIGLFGAGLAGLAFARMRARRKPEDSALSGE